VLADLYPRADHAVRSDKGAFSDANGRGRRYWRLNNRYVQMPVIVEVIHNDRSPADRYIVLDNDGSCGRDLNFVADAHSIADPDFSIVSNALPVCHYVDPRSGIDQAARSQTDGFRFPEPYREMQVDAGPATLEAAAQQPGVHRANAKIDFFAQPQELLPHTGLVIHSGR